jgi:hypothetical protein
MAGTTRLELATSAVTGQYASTGTCRINRLDAQLSAFISIYWLHWDAVLHGLLHGRLFCASLERKYAVVEIRASLSE